jgi:hypothetical protein
VVFATMPNADSMGPVKSPRLSCVTSGGEKGAGGIAPMKLHPGSFLGRDLSVIQ